jgi:hypothetical protein
LPDCRNSAACCRKISHLSALEYLTYAASSPRNDMEPRREMAGTMGDSEQMREDDIFLLFGLKSIVQYTIILTIDIGNRRLYLEDHAGEAVARDAYRAVRQRQVNSAAAALRRLALLMLNADSAPVIATNIKVYGCAQDRETVDFPVCCQRLNTSVRRSRTTPMFTTVRSTSPADPTPP